MSNGDPRLNPGDRPGGEKIVLPDMIYDGVEQARMVALRPHAMAYLEESDAALRQEIADRDNGRLKTDFPSTAAYLAWQKENPRPTASVNASWDERLGIRPTNNLRLLFTINAEGEPAYDTELSRRYIGLLEAQDPQFVAACSIASQAYSEGVKQELELARRGLDPSHDTQVDSVLLSWNCDMYNSEALGRLEALGASPESIRTLTGGSV